MTFYIIFKYYDYDQHKYIYLYFYSLQELILIIIAMISILVWVKVIIVKALAPFINLSWSFISRLALCIFIAQVHSMLITALHHEVIWVIELVANCKIQVSPDVVDEISSFLIDATGAILLVVNCLPIECSITCLVLFCIDWSQESW